MTQTDTVKRKPPIRDLKDPGTSFVQKLGILLEELMELEELSLELQKYYISLIHAHKLLEIKYRVSESICSNPGQHFQQALNSATPGIFQGIPLCKGKVTEMKQSQFFRSLCENIKTRMLTRKVAHCSKIGKYKLMKCLEVLDEIKW
jgi:hypothetical protein